MKQSVTNNKTDKNTGTKSHRIWSVVALVGLFACGLMIGIGVHSNAKQKQSVFSDAQCADLARQIDWNINNSRWADLEIAQKIFAENCDGVMPVNAPNTVKNNPQANIATCQRIESLLLEQLAPEDTNDLSAHVHNVIMYTKLVANGCPENSQKWQDMVNREMEIGKALAADFFDIMLRDSGFFAMVQQDDEPACAEIERAMKNAVADCEYEAQYDRKFSCYLHNAELYSSLVQKGCPENMEQNKEQALRQIEIATALKTEAELNRQEVESVIDTYKKLQMQEQARMLLDKVQRLTNPAIDFILQMERIINE